MIAPKETKQGSILMEYVILTGSVSIVLLGMSNWLFNPAGQMINNRDAIAGTGYGIFGDAWVELTRSIMHGIGSPTPFDPTRSVSRESHERLASPQANLSPFYQRPFAESGFSSFPGFPFKPEGVNPGAIDQFFPLGSLSQRYESGGGGAATVANNPGDPGGASYGTYQLASNTGTLDAFLRSSQGSPYSAELRGLRPGTRAFANAWIRVNNRDPGGFERAQHSFIQATHYEPAARRLNRSTGLDLSDRSRALQNAVWSTAVQHGSAVSPIVNALRGQDADNLSDEEIISRIYRERGRRSTSGELVYFGSSSSSIQQSVANRFRQEEAEALAALAAERELLAGNFPNQ